MAKTIHLQLTGQTETLFRELADLGLTDRQVIAKAIGLLRIAYETGRVALLTPGSLFINDAEEIVEYVFTLQPEEETRALIKDKSIELREKAQRTAEEALARAEATAAEARARADEIARQLKERGQQVYEDVRERGKSTGAVRKTTREEREE